MNYYEKLQELKRKSSKINNQRLRLTDQIIDNQVSIAVLQENYDQKEQELKKFNKINKRINRSTANMIKEIMKSDPNGGILLIITSILICTFVYIMFLLPIFSLSINIIISAILLSLSSSILLMAKLNDTANKKNKKRTIKNIWN